MVQLKMLLLMKTDTNEIRDMFVPFFPNKKLMPFKIFALSLESGRTDGKKQIVDVSQIKMGKL